MARGDAAHMAAMRAAKAQRARRARGITAASGMRVRGSAPRQLSRGATESGVTYRARQAAVYVALASNDPTLTPASAHELGRAFLAAGVALARLVDREFVSTLLSVGLGVLRGNGTAAASHAAELLARCAANSVGTYKPVPAQGDRYMSEPGTTPALDRFGVLVLTPVFRRIAAIAAKLGVWGLSLDHFKVCNFRVAARALGVHASIEIPVLVHPPYRHLSTTCAARRVSLPVV